MCQVSSISILPTRRAEETREMVHSKGRSCKWNSNKTCRQARSEGLGSPGPGEGERQSLLGNLRASVEPQIQSSFSFFHSFNQHLLSTDYVRDPVLGSG